MTTYQVGDILLVNDYDGSTDLLGNLIRAGERARYGDSEFAVWTHSAMIVSTDGELVEALAQGVVKGHVSEYSHVQTLVVSPPIPENDPRRTFAAAFALGHVGDAYDVLDFVSLAGSLLTGWNLSLHTDTRFICSQLCARCTESMTTSGYPYPSEQMMPGDLAFVWDAIPDTPLPPISFFGRLLDKFRAVARSLNPF